MPSPVDSLFVGNWIAIVGLKEQPKDAHTVSDMVFAVQQGPPEEPDWDGRPYQIKAVSLPFLLLEAGGRRTTVDVRKYSVQKLSKKYVQMFNECQYSHDSSFMEIGSRKQEQIASPTTKGCPCCGQRLIERWRGHGVWVLACRRCGFEGSRGQD